MTDHKPDPLEYVSLVFHVFLFLTFTNIRVDEENGVGARSTKRELNTNNAV